MEEKEIEKIVKQIDKFRLVDIISTVYYYYRAIGDYNNMISTVELEYIINIIYKTKSIGKRYPTKDDIISIIELTKVIIGGNRGNKIEEQKEDFIFTYSKNDFRYVKEDKEYNSMVFEYINLFNPVEYFFRIFYSFRIEDFLNFTNLIQIEYSNRMMLINNTLKNSNENVTKDMLIEYLLNSNCNILNFNEKTLTSNKQELIAFCNILNKFSVDEKQSTRGNFEKSPILKKEDTYIVTSIFTLFNEAKYIFEKDIRKDKFLGAIYADKKGEYLEILTENVIRHILRDAKIFPNIKYRENKNDRECDLLVIYDQIILIIEIKGRAFKEISKEGFKQYLEQDLNDNIYKAYGQATRMEKYLKTHNEVSLRFGKGNGVLKIQNTDKFKIFKIGITLENFRTYAVQYTEFNKKIGNDMLFFNINDLKFMAKYFRYQTEFIHYISQRIKVNQYIKEFYWQDELYLFSEYKIFNLQRILNNDHKVKIYDTGRYKLFDLRFDTQKKEQLLTGEIDPLIDEMIRQIEAEKLPTYALTIMNLLDLDYHSQKYIFEQLQQARLKFKQTQKTTHITIRINEEQDTQGIYIVMGVSNKKHKKDCLEGAIILGSMIKRKYPNYEVIGILNDIEDSEKEIIACIKMMPPKAEFDKALDKIQELKSLSYKL